MKRITWTNLILLTLLAITLDASAVQLRFWPQSQVIAPGESGSLAVMLDDVLDVRTVELRISYDPIILQTLDGGPGQLFNDTECFVWWAFEEDEPGEWHGFAVVMDAYCWVTGPGELFFWDFSTFQEGYSRIVVNEVLLYDVDGNPMEAVTLNDTWVFVSDSGTSVPEQEYGFQSWSTLRSLY